MSPRRGHEELAAGLAADRGSKVIGTGCDRVWLGRRIRQLEREATAQQYRRSLAAVNDQAVYRPWNVGHARPTVANVHQIPRSRDGSSGW
jgi:hypothetical protein